MLAGSRGIGLSSGRRDPNLRDHRAARSAAVHDVPAGRRQVHDTHGASVRHCCGGVRVPWMHVAASDSAPQGRPDGSRLDASTSCGLARQHGADRRLWVWTPAQRPESRLLAVDPSPPMERIQLPAGFAPLGEAGARIEVPQSIRGCSGTGRCEPTSGRAADMRRMRYAAASPAPAAWQQPALRSTTAAVPQPPGTGHGSRMRPIGLPSSRPKISPKLHCDAPGAGQMLWAWLGGLGLLGCIAFGLTRIPAERRECHWRARFVTEPSAFGQLGRAPRSRARRTGRRRNPRSPTPMDDPALANAAWAAATLLDQIEQSVKDWRPGRRCATCWRRNWRASISDSS